MSGISTRVFMVVMVLVTSLSMALAQQRSLSGDEVRSLLTGNTILGRWNKVDYRQFFQENGLTIYATRKSQSSLGKWRIGEEHDKYESVWGQGGWVRYDIVSDEGKLFWIDPGGLPPQEFVVLPGEQLVWPEQ